MSANSLRFDLVDHVLVVVHADVAPDDDDWRRLMLVRDANRARIRGNLVIAPPRASINAAQRADVAAFLKETGSSIAVLTDSALIRGVALAVGLAGVKVRAFQSNELAKALSYLVVPPSRQADLSARIDRMKSQLAVLERTSRQARA